MSVSCRIFIGPTIELARDLKQEDFRKADDFMSKHPELDEYVGDTGNLEGRILLIGDGMDGEFLRLVLVHAFIDGESLGGSNEFKEFEGTADFKMINRMIDLYEEYTGKEFVETDLKYAMWSQWY
jgi:hypothetical protein